MRNSKYARYLSLTSCKQSLIYSVWNFLYRTITGTVFNGFPCFSGNKKKNSALRHKKIVPHAGGSEFSVRLMGADNRKSTRFFLLFLSYFIPMLIFDRNNYKYN